MSPRRKTLARFGRRGDQVRVCVDNRRNRIEVYYKDLDGVEHKRVHANTKEGKAEAITWAETYLTERTRIANERQSPEKRAPITIRELWDKYRESPAYTKDLREATRINYRDRWKKWEAFMKPEAIADGTTLDDVDRFRIACEAAGIVLNSVRGILNVVRTVYNWGQTRKLISTNELALHRWKQPKDAPGPLEPGEYSTEEYEALLRTFKPTQLMDGSLFASRNWRPWVALMILGHHGMRFRAVRHIRWTDLDWETGVITWPGEFQKQGKPVEQPITWALLSALIVARFWAERHLVIRKRRRLRNFDPVGRGRFIRDPELVDERIDSPWILFAMTKKMDPFSYSSFQYQLVQAEKNAIVPDGEGGTKTGIPHEKWKGAHAFRRMVVGNLLVATGDLMTAMNYVGDRDIKQSKSYDRRMQDRIDKASVSIEEGR
jgi:integrase